MAADVIHTDQGPAFHNELVQELLRLCAIEQSFATAYSSEENGIVERANQEVLRHLRALLFDSRVHDKWSFEQLPLVQRIMNTVEKTSTGVTPADLILSHAIRLTSHIMSPVSSGIDSSDTSLSDRMDEWISRQHTLLVVPRRLKFNVISTKSLRMTLISPTILSIHMCCIHPQWVVVTSYFQNIEDRIKLEDGSSPYTSLKI